jgi:hypothetical protein
MVNPLVVVIVIEQVEYPSFVYLCYPLLIAVQSEYGEWCSTHVSRHQKSNAIRINAHQVLCGHQNARFLIEVSDKQDK